MFWELSTGRVGSESLVQTAASGFGSLDTIRETTLSRRVLHQFFSLTTTLCGITSVATLEARRPHPLLLASISDRRSSGIQLPHVGISFFHLLAYLCDSTSGSTISSQTLYLKKNYTLLAPVRVVILKFSSQNGYWIRQGRSVRLIVEAPILQLKTRNKWHPGKVQQPNTTFRVSNVNTLLVRSTCDSLRTHVWHCFKF